MSTVGTITEKLGNCVRSFDELVSTVASDLLGGDSTRDKIDNLHNELSRLGRENQRLRLTLRELNVAHNRVIRNHRSKVQDCEALKAKLYTMGLDRKAVTEYLKTYKQPPS